MFHGFRPTRAGGVGVLFRASSPCNRWPYNLVMKRVVHAACPHDCPDACGVLITIEEGRATRIQGDREHPVTRGFLCAKVAKYLDRVYSSGRVLYPMRRIAPKGVAEKQHLALSGFHGMTRWMRLAGDFGGLRMIMGRKPFCPTPTEALWGRSTVLPWTGDFSTGWALRNWSAASARPPAKRA